MESKRLGSGRVKKILLAIEDYSQKSWQEI